MHSQSALARVQVIDNDVLLVSLRPFLLSPSVLPHPISPTLHLLHPPPPVGSLVDVHPGLAAPADTSTLRIWLRGPRLGETGFSRFTSAVWLFTWARVTTESTTRCRLRVLESIRKSGSWTLQSEQIQFFCFVLQAYTKGKYIYVYTCYKCLFMSHCDIHIHTHARKEINRSTFIVSI